MTPIICAQALADVLKDKFSTFKPADAKIADNKITIRSGYLPLASTNEEKAKQSPYIMVRPIAVKDNIETADDESVLDMQILVSTFNTDKENGHLELFHMLEMIRQAILTHGVIGKRFTLKYPVDTIIPEVQPFPTWFAYFTLSYRIPTPEEELIYSE
ncbi:hypothetical protein [Pectinatus frisingensis]|uniref:hypothetical protein n=1 Tax=Pectinatus frisingensis TaxID=865 RepID=UPI0018C7F595|nr:hypothetical protein [Pectinatus frisingensis]